MGTGHSILKDTAPPLQGVHSLDQESGGGEVLFQVWVLVPSLESLRRGWRTEEIGMGWDRTESRVMLVAEGEDWD